MELFSIISRLIRSEPQKLIIRRRSRRIRILIRRRTGRIERRLRGPRKILLSLRIFRLAVTG